MEPQRILTDVSEPSPGASDKTEKRCLRRWMLWITLLILAFLLFIFYIVGEMSLRTALPDTTIASKYEDLELF
jgi:hypothetical protein